MAINKVSKLSQMKSAQMILPEQGSIKESKPQDSVGRLPLQQEAYELLWPNILAVKRRLGKNSFKH